ncbi:hypothetical protein FisN_30Lh109 [Fistulifera solaris]|uniref:Methyltransferase FkbM domain-containing protein n=1 Tax=Fistulifera solaris TaxID=1519565 RepID=A0A1Z5JIH9_FISSO|nr:hypothetical protein FisN_30Lh109 [Fistulifera solaris]|eukprot:GAX13813.1 hypothetical protein FisN_30Lh109 [Fistulifera solaris]
MVIAIVVFTLNNNRNNTYLRSPETIVPVATATVDISRPLPITSVQTCPRKSLPQIRQLKINKSQSGEDFVLLRWFNGLCQGTFIELGALDGIKFSNSYLFEFALQWQGLLVEITPPSFAALQKNRPNNVLVHAGVCEQRQTIHYYNSTANKTAVPGIVEFASPQFRQRWWPDLKADWSNSVEMECIPLQEIIEEHYVPAIKRKQHIHNSTSRVATTTTNEAVHFDFLSLDVEGAEDQVLRSIDFDKVSFGIVLLEADDYNELKNLAVRVFLESKGYLFLKSEQRSYWFVHKQFDQIYRHVLHQ